MNTEHIIIFIHENKNLNSYNSLISNKGGKLLLLILLFFIFGFFSTKIEAKAIIRLSVKFMKTAKMKQ